MSSISGLHARSWPSRGNIHAEYHYHSGADEVIGIAAGSAILGIGGPHSVRIAVDASDVLVLPAGTGHCRLSDSAGFSVVTANPPGQEPDICRELASTEIERAIDAVPYPTSDPVRGSPQRFAWKSASVRRTRLCGSPERVLVRTMSSISTR
jgi:uncharacterized protein YjlB